MSKSKETTLAMVDRLHEIVQVGRLSKTALRAAFGPNISEFQFGRAFSEARRMLRDEGYFIKPDVKNRGTYIIATAEDVTTLAMDKTRHKVVKTARDRMAIIQAAQRHPGMDDDSRSRLQTEELLYGRTLQFMERSLLKSQRKKPEGLE